MTTQASTQTSTQSSTQSAVNAPGPEQPNRSFLSDAYYRFLRGSSALQSPFLLLVRLYWGWQFAATGWGKLHHLGHVTQFFSSLGLPAPGPTAVIISLVEFIGGILLIAGVASRVTGLILAGDMIVAYYVADSDALHSILSDPGKFYGADPYTFLFASLLILIFGPGRFSVDYWIWRRGSSGARRRPC